ncbi:replication-relaxation family protein [Alkalihalobacillus sp. LMS6]|uniref:replication-relaxation family protein n=1 Tax=Alkalihalobacillus sp. LMS6 TaxID=2924034 RepID=UPI0020D1D7C7|nr:replication-relaxation family protein [Alkalihalobacillus sp. LMS6]UTR05130.1 replication-relaxation family protein [Alkalihalobacillus sp. LMS6]
MKKRDLAIINDLRRFRVLRRDDIADLYFRELKQPVTSANFVLKRLRRDGQITAITDRQPYVYTCADSGIKRDSAKIPHFLRIAECYRALRDVQAPRIFEVEPKLGAKGTVEPDAFALWRGAPFYIEIQRSVYSAKTFDAKLNRYVDYYNEGKWREESWQPKGKAPIFPYVWVITDVEYAVGSLPFRVIQTKDFRLN